MIAASTLAFVFAALFGLLAPPVARRVRPSAAVWLLTVGGVVAGLCMVCVLGLLALPLVGTSVEFAEAGHWSVHNFEQRDPTNNGLAWLSFAVLLVTLGRIGIVAWRHGRALRATGRASRDLHRLVGGLVILPEDEPDAYALPGRRGCVVVTSGLLRRLDPAGWRLVLAHEIAHVHRRHHRHLFAVRLSMTANVLLARLGPAQEFCVERWADESAAAVVGRRVAARAFGKAADLLGGTAERPAGALAVASCALDTRAAALSRPPLGLRPALLLAAVGCAVGAFTATAVALNDAGALFARVHPATSHAERP
ncbi:MAG: M48 family metalloprotease [Frankiales bacterium]|nr:M48 family metalloprotease [Frankiales bacterium]